MQPSMITLSRLVGDWLETTELNKQWKEGLGGYYLAIPEEKGTERTICVISVENDHLSVWRGHSIAFLRYQGNLDATDPEMFSKLEATMREAMAEPIKH